MINVSRRRRCLGAALAAMIGMGAAVLTPAPAQALDHCSVGQRVVKPGGKQGVVTAVQGTGCTVRADGEPFTST